jgi:hypothetical protein
VVLGIPVLKYLYDWTLDEGEPEVRRTSSIGRCKVEATPRKPTISWPAARNGHIHINE